MNSESAAEGQRGFWLSLGSGMMQNDSNLCKTLTRQWGKHTSDGRKAQPPVLPGSRSTVLPDHLPTFRA
jgi:hypothetical protein